MSRGERGSALRLLAIGAVVVLAMFSSYELGVAGGQLLVLVLPLALTVFVVAALVVLHADAGADAIADSVGWRRFELELERARRHERPLALLRIEASSTARVGQGRRPDADANAVREAVRVLDAVWVDHGYTYVLMPETDRVALARAIGRITAHLPGIGLDAMRAAVFPTDGLTAGALIDRLNDSEAKPRPGDIVRLAPQTVDVTTQHRTG